MTLQEGIGINNSHEKRRLMKEKIVRSIPHIVSIFDPLPKLVLVCGKEDEMQTAVGSTAGVASMIRRYQGRGFSKLWAPFDVFFWSGVLFL